LTQEIGQRVALTDLFHQKNPEINSEGRIVITNVWNFPESFISRYDLEIELDREHGYLPKHVSYCIFGGTRKVKTVVSDFTVSKFFRDSSTGLWVPVDVTFRRNGVVSTRVVVIEQSIAVNENPSIESYRVQFPTDIDVLDAPNRQLLRAGKVVQQLPPLSTPDAGWSLTQYLWIGLGVLVASIVTISVAKRRGLVCLALIGLASIVVGCSEDKKAKRSEESFKSVLVLDDHQVGVVEFPEGDKKRVSINVGSVERAAFSLPIRNVSRERLKFSETISTTCGCTNATLNPLVLDPGEIGHISGEVESSPIPGRKTIGLRLIVKEPAYKELSVHVEAEFTGDWVLSNTKVLLDGLAGRDESQVIEVSGSDDALKKIRYSTTGKVQVQELEASQGESRRFRVTGTLSSTTIEEQLGSIIFQCSSGKPFQNEVFVAGIGRSTSRWNPKLMSIFPDKGCEAKLSLGEGDELVSVSATEGIRIERRPKGEGNPLSVFFDCTFDSAVEHPSTLGSITAILEHRGNSFSIHSRVVFPEGKPIGEYQ